MLSIAQAKQIPILDVVLRLGASEPKQKKPNEIFLKSWRGERTASLKVNPVDNWFKDFGDPNSKKGSTIDAVIDARDIERERRGHARRGRWDKDAIREAMKYLEFFENMPNVYRALPAPKQEPSPVWQVVEKDTKEYYTTRHCKAEIGRRKLDGRAGEYLKQVTVVNSETGKARTVFGMENRQGGTELHMHYPDNENREFRNFKAVAGHKDVTVFPAHYEEKNTRIYAFSSKWDFVTLMHRQERSKDVTYVIYHGDGLVGLCAEYIAQRKAKLGADEQITTVVHFDHTDDGGRDADHALARLVADIGLHYLTKSETYKANDGQPCKDFSEWHMKHSAQAWDGQKPTFFHSTPRNGYSYRMRH